jgi:hypothetical protein
VDVLVEEVQFLKKNRCCHRQILIGRLIKNEQNDFVNLSIHININFNWMCTLCNMLFTVRRINVNYYDSGEF